MQGLASRIKRRRATRVSRCGYGSGATASSEPPRSEDYKIKTIDRDPGKMNKVIPELGNDATRATLDGEPLEFQSSFRPRARDLYFNYSLQILRLASRG
jgi:hypothetical protein